MELSAVKAHPIRRPEPSAYLLWTCFHLEEIGLHCAASLRGAVLDIIQHGISISTKKLQSVASPRTCVAFARLRRHSTHLSELVHHELHHHVAVQGVFHNALAVGHRRRRPLDLLCRLRRFSCAAAGRTGIAHMPAASAAAHDG